MGRLKAIGPGRNQAGAAGHFGQYNRAQGIAHNAISALPRGEINAPMRRGSISMSGNKRGLTYGEAGV
ncbi:MAG: hypothetical protein AB7V13_06835, partial [Pseudorhodoplanes sp.]